MSRHIPENIEKFGLDKIWSDRIADFYYELWWLNRTGEIYSNTGDSAWASRIAKRYGIRKPTKEKKR